MRVEDGRFAPKQIHTLPRSQDGPRMLANLEFATHSQKRATSRERPSNDSRIFDSPRQSFTFRDIADPALGLLFVWPLFAKKPDIRETR